MAKQPKKLPETMTNEELRDRFFALQKRIGWVNKNMLWIAGGIAAAGLVTGLGLAIAGVVTGATAMAGIISTSLVAGGSGMSLCSMIRDTSWEDEAMRLKSENNTRFIVAEAQQRRAAAEEARKLSEQFKAAIEAVSEGRGIDADMTVRKPLRLKSKSLFGAFAA